MAKGTLTAVADDVATLITATVMASSGTVSRMYVPLKDLPELTALTVMVAPRMEKRDRQSRKVWFHDYTVDVGIAKRVEDDDDSDDLTALAETLANLLEDTPLPTVQASLIESKTIGPDPDQMDQKSVFLVVLTVTYQGGRQQA